MFAPKMYLPNNKKAKAAYVLASKQKTNYGKQNIKNRILSKQKKNACGVRTGAKKKRK